MGHCGSLYDYIIHVALIATLCVSLTISSKPPLVIPCQHLLVSSTSSPENQLEAYSWCQAYTCMYVQLTEDHFIEGGHLSPPFHQPEEAQINRQALTRHGSITKVQSYTGNCIVTSA